jgi:hypothetical protein
LNVAEKNRAVEARLVQANFATAIRYTIRDEPNFRVVLEVHSAGYDDTASKGNITG